MGSKVVSTGSSHSRLINGDNKSSIRSIASSISNWSSSSINSTINSLGSKMVSTCSSNSRFIKRNNSSVGVSNELSVQVKGASITVGSSISWAISSIISSVSSIAKTSIAIPSTIPSISITSSISWSIASISQTCSKLGSKMVSTGSSNCWLINRSHSSVRVGLQTIETLGRGYGHTGSENQKLHICSE